MQCMRRMPATAGKCQLLLRACVMQGILVHSRAYINPQHWRSFNYIFCEIPVAFRNFATGHERACPRGCVGDFERCAIYIAHAVHRRRRRTDRIFKFSRVFARFISSTIEWPARGIFFTSDRVCLCLSAACCVRKHRRPSVQ